jgi:hypothetical protein
VPAKDCDQEELVTPDVGVELENQSLGDFNEAQPMQGVRLTANSNASLDLRAVRMSLRAMFVLFGVQRT